MNHDKQGYPLLRQQPQITQYVLRMKQIKYDRKRARGIFSISHPRQAPPVKHNANLHYFHLLDLDGLEQAQAQASIILADIRGWLAEELPALEDERTKAIQHGGSAAI